MKTIIATILIMLGLVASAHAGGSIDFSEVKQLLKEKPEFASIVSTLQIEENGMAEIVIDFKQPHLGGQRLGPYTFDVKSKEKQKMELLLCTKPHFKDAKGKERTYFDATEVTESLNAIIIRKSGASVTCPTKDDT